MNVPFYLYILRILSKKGAKVEEIETKKNEDIVYFSINEKKICKYAHIIILQGRVSHTNGRNILKNHQTLRTKENSREKLFPTNIQETVKRMVFYLPLYQHFSLIKFIHLKL